MSLTKSQPPAFVSSSDSILQQSTTGNVSGAYMMPMVQPGIIEINGDLTAHSTGVTVADLRAEIAKAKFDATCQSITSVMIILVLLIVLRQLARRK